MQLLFGTSKGLVVFEFNGDDWEINKVHFEGLPVSLVYVDERNDTWWVSLAHRHWGQKLHRSKDNGQNWEQVTTPRYPENTFIKKDKPASLKKIWAISHAGYDNPDGLWLGTEPGGLFYSEDNGNHFELVESLWNHPSRRSELQWFGAGRDFPFIHSIVVDPRDSQHVYIAVSCAGVFETKDGGQTWLPKNNGLIAAYLPNPTAEVGHDPHLLLACPSDPSILWQQNHCGIFRSTNGGASWDNVTDKNGIANYGFALVIDEKDPKQAWVIPAVSDEVRVAPNLSLSVYHTKDAGQNWTTSSNGLPQQFAFDIVFRHSFFKKGNVLAFGTTTGNAFVSTDCGQNWSVLSNYLARIESVFIV